MAAVGHDCFLDRGETFNAEEYRQEIDEMRKKLRRLCPRMVYAKGKVLLYDSVRPYLSQSTLLKLRKLWYTTLTHTAHSPDISPTDYHFSNISKTYFVINTSKTKRMPRTLSTLSRSSERRTSAQAAKLNQLHVCRNVSLVMLLTLVNKLHSKRNYYCSKLTMESRKNVLYNTSYEFSFIILCQLFLKY